MRDNFVLNMRIEQAKQEARDAFVEAIRETFIEKIKPEAQRLSPREAELPKGHQVHNADSIGVSVRKTASGVTAKIFTQSGHGGYIELGTKKMAARPYLYPAVMQFLGEIPLTLKRLIQTKGGLDKSRRVPQ